MMNEMQVNGYELLILLSQKLSDTFAAHPTTNHSPLTTNPNWCPWARNIERYVNALADQF